MPSRIQRLAKGLNELLSLQGSGEPQELEDRVRVIIDGLQFYGLMQLQSQGTNNAAAAEGAAVTVTPSSSSWTMLFNASVTIVKTATVTALYGSLAYRRIGVSDSVVAGSALGPFGATETGAVVVPYSWTPPLLLPPGSLVIGRAAIIGTDATANVTTFAEFGVLG